MLFPSTSFPVLVALTSGVYYLPGLASAQVVTQVVASILLYSIPVVLYHLVQGTRRSHAWPPAFHHWLTDQRSSCRGCVPKAVKPASNSPSGTAGARLSGPLQGRALERISYP